MNGFSQNQKASIYVISISGRDLDCLYIKSLPLIEMTVNFHKQYMQHNTGNDS